MYATNRLTRTAVTYTGAEVGGVLPDVRAMQAFDRVPFER